MEQQVVQKAPEQTKKPTPNLTGIPTQMKLDFERRSGLSFDDVRVHYNSDKPRKIGALAYTQIPQVHIGPGQERHLRHELGHVVQQKQGIVRPTTWINGLPVNDSQRLENAADNELTIQNTYPKLSSIPRLQPQVAQKQGGMVRQRDDDGVKEFERAPKKREFEQQVSNASRAIKRQLGVAAVDPADVKKTLRYARFGAYASLVFLRIPEIDTQIFVAKRLVKDGKFKELLEFDGKVGLVHGRVSYKEHRAKQLMRWVATVSSFFTPENDEVQCYLLDSSEIIVSANSNKSNNAINAFLSRGRTIKYLISQAEAIKKEPGRQERHFSKLKEKKLVAPFVLHSILEYSEKYPVLGTDGMHAEIKIVLYLRFEQKDFEIKNLGGIRPPCLCCASVLLDVIPEKHQHIKDLYKTGNDAIYRVGPFWPSRNALIGVAAYLTIHKQSELSKFESFPDALVNFVLENFQNIITTLTLQVSHDSEIGTITHAHDCDSDSEDEDED